MQVSCALGESFGDDSARTVCTLVVPIDGFEILLQLLLLLLLLHS